jgi:hypothetical protein
MALQLLDDRHQPLDLVVALGNLLRRFVARRG